MRRLYLDHNASSPLRESARALLAEWSAGSGGANPSSAHREGRLARRSLEDARERLSALVGCEPGELVFTSGGTESNSWALSNWNSVAVLPTEHPSVLAAARSCSGFHLLPLDAGQHIDLAAAGALLASCEVASLALANHETGQLQPVKAVAEHHADREWLLHTDASQAFGRMPISFRGLGVDLMTLSAHKLGGPTGMGALIIRQGIERPPLHVGGPQESMRRAGTESVLLAELFAAAAEEACSRQSVEDRQWREFMDRLRSEIPRLDPSAIFLSSDTESLTNTLCVAFPGRPGQALVHRLDLEGVSLSHGSACASGSLEPSPVLSALGWPEEVSRSSLRISLGHGHQAGDVDRFLQRLATTLAAVRVRDTEQKKSAGDGQ